MRSWLQTGVSSTRPVGCRATLLALALPTHLLTPVHQLRPDLQILSIHLLHEVSKGPASFWHPYLQQLPRQFTTLMSWPTEAVEALQLQYAQEAAAAAQAKARSEWAAARPALKELGMP